MDPLFRVEIISSAVSPQQIIYAAMHQDYAEGFVWDEFDRFPDENRAGELIVKNLLAGNRGHFGPLEHPQIVLNCGWFPHSTMQQIRTHRVGVSFDVQSFRYTGKRIYDAGQRFKVTGDMSIIDEIFYLRPVGTYSDRQGCHYSYDEDWRNEDLKLAADAAVKYFTDVSLGKSEEHARGLIPFDVRQHWIMSANVRSLMHLLDLRWKLDAQLECQQLCDLIWPHFENWVPSIAAWYKSNRAQKARLAP